MTPEEIEKYRGEIAAMIPQAIRCLKHCMVSPGRHALVQMQAVKMIFDRSGLLDVIDTKLPERADRPQIQLVILDAGQKLPQHIAVSPAKTSLSPARRAELIENNE